MVSYVAYVMRASGDQYDSYGETLILASLRIMQDCPANAIVSRRVSWMFKR
jgi:transformation/transcription domain-associated protein